MEVGAFYAIGFTLIAVGIIVIIVAIILISMRGAGKSKVKGAGVIMIGPVPIIFGTDKKSLEAALVLAIVLVVTLIVFYLLLR